MTKKAILSHCETLGRAKNKESAAAFMEQHRFRRYRDLEAKKNTGKVPLIDMMRAYTDGLRFIICGEG